jgi:SAM-dependent methyltransferase
MAGREAGGVEPREGCPVCGQPASAPFAEIDNVTVQVNVLHATEARAREAERGDIRLCVCDVCGFIWNGAFDARLVEYDGEYENSLHYSPAFEVYAAALAERLRDRYDLRGRHVVEIGCGQANFLRRLCAVGGNRGTGFDPSYVGPERDGPVTVRRALYSEAGLGDAAPDFLCCQHVLEHIEQPLEFIRSVRRTLGGESRTPVYFEVPNGEYQLEHDVVWDMIYAHFATFTRPALRVLFERGGFEVVDMGTSFGDQYLWVEARPVEHSVMSDVHAEVARIRALARRFGAGQRLALRSWRERVDGYRAEGQRVYLWGAGAKGVTLLDALGHASGVGGVVDVNPRKQGTFVPGSAVPVLAPDALPEHPPDVVVLANPIYRDEVRRMLVALGQRPRIVCL